MDHTMSSYREMFTKCQFLISLPELEVNISILSSFYTMRCSLVLEAKAEFISPSTRPIACFSGPGLRPLVKYPIARLLLRNILLLSLEFWGVIMDSAENPTSQLNLGIKRVQATRACDRCKK